MKKLIVVLMAVLALCSSVEAGKESKDMNPNFISKVDMKMVPFKLQQVKLLDGRIKDELELNRVYLHEGAPPELGNIQFDTETYLHIFRDNAGLPAPGKEMGHTETVQLPNRAKGQYSGHILSGYAMMYAATGDEFLKKRSDEMVAGLAECQDALGDGYLGAYPKKEFDAVEDMVNICHDVPYYCQHKLMAGLWDQYRYADNKQALSVLKKSAKWFAERYKGLSPEVIRHMQQFENGGMIEMFYNLYGLTGDKDFLMAGKVMRKDLWFEQLAQKDPMAIRKHGNVHTPLITGAARHYELTGDLRSRGIAEFFWNKVSGTRSYATGGSTVHEGFGLENQLAGTLCENTVESCVVYNMLKLTRHLYAWTADPKYGDFYERAYYNHIIGSIGEHGGIKTYSQALGHGSKKKNHGPTSCCYGTAMESFSKLADSIYFYGDDALFVNLYIGSELDWKSKGVKIKQETSFPESENMTFTVESRRSKKFALNLRVPYWATKGITVKVNGKKVDTASAKPTSWFALDRKWKNGDKVELSIPMSLHYHPMPDDKNLVAVMYGPLVLAGELDKRDFIEKVRVSEPEDAGDGKVYLTAAHAVSALTGAGNVGNNESFMATPLKMEGKVYKHGVGTHASSVIKFDLKGKCSRLTALVGRNEERGTIEFIVKLDGKKIYSSGIIKDQQKPKPVDVSLKGGRKLELIVTDGGDGMGGDHANWCDLAVETTDSSIFMNKGGTGAFVLRDMLMDEIVPAKYYFTGDRAKLDKWIKPVAGKKLTFKTVGQPNDVVLRPYNVFRPHARTDYSDLVGAQGLDLSFKAEGKSKDGFTIKKLPDEYNSNERFEVYWVFAKDGNDPKIKTIREEQAKFLEQKERMVDVVMPRNPTENVPYRNRKAEGCSFGNHMVFAEGKGAWFSWDMKVTPDKPMSALVYYTSRLFRPADAIMRGNDFWNSSCDILVDGKVIGGVKPQKPDVPWNCTVEYSIPEELTKGKDVVTVKFQTHPGRSVKVWACATVER